MSANEFQFLADKIEDVRRDLKGDIGELKGNVEDLYEKRGNERVDNERRLSRLEQAEDLRDKQSAHRVGWTTFFSGILMTCIGWLISFFTGVHHRP